MENGWKLLNLGSETEFHILRDVLINAHQVLCSATAEWTVPSSVRKAKRSAPVNKVSPEACCS